MKILCRTVVAVFQGDENIIGFVRNMKMGDKKLKVNKR